MSCSPLKGCWIIAGHELEVSVTLVGDANTLLSCVHGKKNWKRVISLLDQNGLCQNHVSNFWHSSEKVGGRLAECSGNDQRCRKHGTHGKIGRIKIV